MPTYSHNSPESVVERAFRAFRQRSAVDLAQLVLPESLLRFREAVVVQSHPEWRVWTAEELRRHSPEMPLEVAEYQVREMEQRRANHETALLARFPDTRSLNELESLSPMELLDRRLRSLSAGPIEIAHCRVLGHVLDGERTAFVVFWLGAQNTPDLDEPRLAKVELASGEWKLVLDPYSDQLMPGFRNIFFGEIAADPGA